MHFSQQRIVNSVVIVITPKGSAHCKVGQGVMMGDRNAPDQFVEQFKGPITVWNSSLAMEQAGVQANVGNRPGKWRRGGPHIDNVCRRLEECAPTQLKCGRRDRESAQDEQWHTQQVVAARAVCPKHHKTGGGPGIQRAGRGPGIQAVETINA